ncbi:MULTISPECIES: OmpH family outer membrane protein [unclassified Corallococcus]|uniref:OmpH family outer membrane protein n=1 Tax=unclassified Corallococcus TaxID=2685029 RepID=UPI001A8E45A1|nr:MULTISPECIES: OmpH family outer membrane protein [unclassified Corallococcus]MBN9686604.1 OmpH family outer membrane protein [Corallococcus sp. NCSPR001]WAS81975.1 OmpH family outer membrane protein [Corallococcus sp. NCRR]
MSLRSTLAAAAAVLSLALPVAASAAELKVAYVDLQRVLLEVDDGKAAKARLQKWLEDRQKEIDKEQDALRKEKDTLDKQASAMSEATRTQKATELQKKVMELAQKYERSRSEAANKERQEMEPIVNRIDQVIASIAERDGLGMVLDKRDSGIVFALSQYDISNEVVRSYNNSASKKPAPAAKDAPVKK